MEQRMVCLAKNRQRRINSHSRNGFAAVLGHGKDTVFQFLVAISEGFLHALSLFFRKLRHTLIGDF